MNRARHACGVIALAVAIGLGGHVVVASGQDLSLYRTYALGSALADVAAAAGAGPSDIKVRHERPTAVQQFHWRAPYTSSDAADADPVDAITFDFVEGRLYQLTVTYDRRLTRGLTTADLVSAMADSYGAPDARTSGTSGATTDPVLDAIVLARWADAQATVTLTRGPHEAVQLVVRAEELGARATAAIRAAQSLEASEAPLRREQARAAEAAGALAERTRNKAAFKP